jgi:hypothetical protein
MSEDKFFDAIENSAAELGPTDKSYKVYVTVKDTREGQPRVVASANYDAGPEYVKVTAENIDSLPLSAWERKSAFEGNGRWVMIGAHGSTRQDKFYFQHLSDEGQKRFIELHNAKRLRIGYPGYFYSRPFFCAPV